MLLFQDSTGSICTCFCLCLYLSWCLLVETCGTGDHEYIDIIIDNNSGSSERLIVDIDFRSHFEIARAVDSYDRILNSLPVVYVGSFTRLKQFLGIMEEATRSSLKQNSMPLPPWRSLAYLQAKWQSPYERYTHSEGNNISDSDCFDHKQCCGHLKRLQSCLQSGIEIDRLLKPRNSESNWRMKPERWRHPLLRPLWHVQILALKLTRDWTKIIQNYAAIFPSMKSSSCYLISLINKRQVHIGSHSNNK